MTIVIQGGFSIDAVKCDQKPFAAKVIQPMVSLLIQLSVSSAENKDIKIISTNSRDQSSSSSAEPWT